MLFAQSLAVFLLATRVSSRHVHLHHRAALLYGPSGTCPAVGTTTYEIQPVYYSDFVPTNTIFDPFHNGDLVTVTNAPTVVIMVAYVTTIITPSTTVVSPPGSGTLLPNGGAGGAGGSGGSGSTTSEQPGGLGSQYSHTGPGSLPGGALNSSPSLSVMTGPPRPPSSAPVDSDSLISSRRPSSGPASVSAQSQSSSEELGSTESYTNAGQSTSPTSLVSPPPTTGISLQTTPPESISISGLPASQSPLTIGAGVPKGLITSLPAASPILLAFNDMGLAQRLGIGRRQDNQVDAAGPASTPTTASPISVVNLATVAGATPSGSNAPGSVSQENCDDATPFILSDGLLLHNHTAVGKLRGATTAVLGSLGDGAPPDQVNNTFSLNNGFLGWATDDVGEANFFSCQDIIWAGFPNSPDATCSQVEVGAIAAEACSSRVQQTGTVNPSLLPTNAGVLSSSATSSSGITGLSSPTTTSASAGSIASESTPSAAAATASSTILPSAIENASTTILSSGSANAPSSGLSPSLTATVPSTLSSVSTPGMTIITPSPLIPVTSSLPVYQACNQDNCLRNLADTRYYSSAGIFCSSYTVSSAFPTPSWLGGCNSDPSRISSACSCLLPQSTQGPGSSYSTSSLASSLGVSQTQSLSTTDSGSGPLQSTTSSLSFSLSTTASTSAQSTPDGIGAYGTSGSFQSPSNPSSMSTASTSVHDSSQPSLSGPAPQASSSSSGFLGPSMSVSTSSPSFASSLSFSATASSFGSSTTISSPVSSSTSVKPTATGQLCAGQNLGSQGGTNIGAYNYQVVERDLTSPFYYEIECYALLTAAPVGSLRVNIYTFEDCIDACSQINQNSGAGSCQGVSYNATVAACLLHNVIGMSGDYPYYGGPNVFSARLIYPYYSVINDAFYLQYSSATSDLGLCVNNAYFHDVISPQWIDTFDNNYENYCGQYLGGSNPVDPAYVAAYAAQLPGNISPGGIQTTEDCLKVCDYGNHYQQYQCAMYVFDTTYKLCSLYGSTNGQITINPTVNAGRLINSAVGYPKPTDRTSATTYSTPYQYVTSTAVYLSTGSGISATASVSANSVAAGTQTGTSTGTTASYGGSINLGQTPGGNAPSQSGPNSPGGSSTGTTPTDSSSISGLPLPDLSSVIGLSSVTLPISYILPPLSTSLGLPMSIPSIPSFGNLLSTPSGFTLPTPSVPNIVNPLSTISNMNVPSFNLLSTISNINLPSIDPSDATPPDLPTLPTPSLSLTLSIVPPVIPTTLPSLSLLFTTPTIPTPVTFPSANIPLQSLSTCPAASLLPLNPLSVSDGQGHSYLATFDPVGLVTITICTVVSLTSSPALNAPSTPNANPGSISSNSASNNGLNAPTATTSLGTVISPCSAVPVGGIINNDGQYYLTFDPQQGAYVTVCATNGVGGGSGGFAISTTTTTASGMGYSGIGFGMSSTLPILPAVTSLPACASGTQGNNGPLGQFFTTLDPILQAYVTVCAVMGANVNAGVGAGSSGVNVNVEATVGVSQATAGVSVNVNPPSVSAGASASVGVDVNAGSSGVNVGVGGGVGGGLGVGVGSTTLVNAGVGVGAGASIGVGIGTTGVNIGAGIGPGSTTLSVGVGVGVGVNSGGATVSVNVAGLPCIGLNCGSGSATTPTSTGMGYGGSSTSGAGQAAQLTTKYTSTTRTAAAAPTTTHSLSPYVSNVCVFGLPCVLTTLYV